MRLSRIIIALMAGFAMLALPAAVGAAPAVQPQPTAPEEQPTYPPGPASLRVSQPTIVLGETVVLHGADFWDGEMVGLSIVVNPLASAPLDVQRARRGDGSTVAMAPVAYPRQVALTLPQAAPLPSEVRADAKGEFKLNYRPSTVGNYVFTATGRDSDRSARATLTVLQTVPQPTAPSDDDDDLPTTGDNLGITLATGGGLVGLGGIMLVLAMAWRRRRSGPNTTA